QQVGPSRGSRARDGRVRRPSGERPLRRLPRRHRAGHRAVTEAPIGLIAGSGRLPLLFAEAAERAGRSVVAVAHEGETDHALNARAWVKVGQLGRIVEVLRQAGVGEAGCCAAIRKARLLDVRPDWLGREVLTRLAG